MWNKKEMSQLDATLTRVPLTLTFDFHLWPWIFKVKLYLGNGRPDSHGTEGTGVDGIPWCETLRKWVKWTLCWLGYLWPWPLTLNFQGQIVSREWEVRLHGAKGTGVDRMSWCETLRKWVNWTLCWLGYLGPWIFKVKLYLGNARPNCHETKGAGVDRMPQPLWPWDKG